MRIMSRVSGRARVIIRADIVLYALGVREHHLAPQAWHQHSLLGPMGLLCTPLWSVRHIMRGCYVPQIHSLQMWKPIGRSQAPNRMENSSTQHTQLVPLACHAVSI